MLPCSAGSRTGASRYRPLIDCFLACHVESAGIPRRKKKVLPKNVQSMERTRKLGNNASERTRVITVARRVF